MKPPPHCCSETSVSRIKVEQKGRKAVFINESHLNHTKICVDGCVIVNSKSADYIVSRCDLGDAVIELKGKNVEEAVKQVEATASHWVEKGYCRKGLAALVVSTQFPKANTAVRKAQERFTRAFKGPLHVVTKNFEGQLEAIFSFRGPHKV